MPTTHGHVLPSCLAVAVAVLAMGRVVCNDFAWDDAQSVLHNPAVHSLGNVPRCCGLGFSIHALRLGLAHSQARLARDLLNNRGGVR